MKKVTVFILVLCCMLSLSACGHLNNDELRATIPTMAVVAAGSQQAASSISGGDWTYKGQSLAVDALHPLQSLDTLSADSALSASAGSEIFLNFSVLPDSVTVMYWSADESANDSIPEGQTAEVSFNNNLFSFTVPAGSGDLVLQAQAAWNSYSDRSGSMGYGFLIHR